MRSILKKAIVIKNDKKQPVFSMPKTPEANCEIMASMLDFIYTTPTMCADRDSDINLSIHNSILKSDMDVLESWFAILPRKKRVKSRFKIDSKHGWVKSNSLMWGKKRRNLQLGVKNIGSWLLQGHDLDVTHWIYAARRMQVVRDKNLELLLSQKKLHLVLDIDNTLIHHIEVAKKDGMSSLVMLRPGVLAFLRMASRMFELSIYTMGSRYYAERIVGLLDPDKSLFNGRIKSREDCTTRKQKGLNVVASHPRVVLIVDDKVDVWAENDRSHVIPVARYSYLDKLKNSDINVVVDDNDKEMGRVWGVLSKVHSRFFECREEDWKSRDVAEVLQSVPMPDTDNTLVDNDEIDIS